MISCVDAPSLPVGQGAGPDVRASYTALRSGTLRIMKAMTWPTLNPQDQWLIEGLEKELLESTQTGEELMAEAQRLRAQAAETDIKAYREADLMAAANYELVAAERLAPA